MQRRREKLAYGCLFCSSVDKKKNRRSKNMKMTQPRIKPIAKSWGKGYNERKHLTTRRKASGAPKKTVRWNERGTRRLEDMEPTPRRTTDNNLKNNFRSEEVFGEPWKVIIDFVHDLTSYHVLTWLPAAAREMNPRSDRRERRKSNLGTCGRDLSSKGREKEK